MQKLDATILKIIDWGTQRGITTNGKPITQAIKTLEECHELLEAINKDDKAEIQDAIGDIVVTLIMQCELQGVELTTCLEGAYNEIKDRRGYLDHTGNFIKEQNKVQTITFDALTGATQGDLYV